MFTPSQTPADIVAKFHQELQKALQAPAVKDKLAALGIEPMPLTTAKFDAQVKQEVARYVTFAKAVGLKPNWSASAYSDGVRQGGGNQMEKLVPQPQDAVACGLLIRNDAPIKSSTKSISEPAR